MSRCSVCQHENPSGARFCNACGAPIDEGAGPVGETYRRVERSLLEQLAPTVRGEHRLVTCLFADLSGSVERTRDLAPESATALVNSLLEAMVEVLVKFGGTIDRFLGDGVLAVFGVPHTHEDDPERAVRAALQLRQRASELGLEVTVGVNTGRVYFGPVGSSLHEELTVMGPVVNLAARLQGKAQAGQVVIAAATHSHVQAAFLTTPVTYEVKGIEQPVTAYLADRLLDLPEKVRGIRGLHAQLVGRREELAALEALLEDRGGLAVVEGEPGVGKSRLVAEFRKHVETLGGRWLEGRCTELTQDTAYSAMRDLLARETATPESLSHSLTTPEGRHMLGDDWFDELAPFLMALVSDQQPAAVAAAGEQERRSLTGRAVSDYLRMLASAGPLVVVFDDLHWADPLTGQLVSTLTKRAAEDGVLYVLVTRPSPASTVEPVNDHLSISLTELSAGESRQLITSMLRIDGLPEELEASIIARAEGNPFFVEEIVRSFIQQGIVVREGDTWTAPAGFAEVEIPESVLAIVASRLDRLADESRMTAQYASVLDRTFPLEVLNAMAATELESHLDVLVDAGLLVVEKSSPGTEYSFWHALTREGVYDTLLPSQRLELHGRAGEAYERVAPDEIEQLAYQYERSRLHEKAVHYLTAAARHAGDSFLNRAALDYANRGLDRVGELSADPAGLRAELHGLRGEVLERLARHEEAQAELRTAIEAGPADPLLEGRLTTTLAMSLRNTGNYEAAHELYERAESILTGSPESEDISSKHALIDLGRERAFAYYFEGRQDELAAHNVELGRLVEEHGTPTHRMEQLIGLALADYGESRFLLDEEAVRRLEPVMELARRSGNPGRLADAHFALGFARLWADDLEGAVSLLGEAVQRCERIGDMTTLTRASSYYAIALRRIGHVEEASAAAERAERDAGSLGNSYYRGHALATRAWVAWRQGTFDEANDLIEAAASEWGLHEVEPGRRIDVPAGFRSLGTEFAWMTVWPAVAIGRALERHDSIPRQLDYLRSPWERAMPGDLAEAAEAARLDPSPAKVDAALTLAKAHRLL